jgi:predicted O-methyltransferase YrrM
LIEQTRLVWWFLRRPAYYPVLRVFLARKLNPTDDSLDKTREESLAWCRSLSVDTTTAIRRIAGSAPTLTVRQLHPRAFAFAEQAAADCPVQMGGAGDLDLLYNCAEYLKAERVVETGVAYGWSSLALLLSLDRRASSRLISTDLPYPERNNAPYVGCVVPPSLRDRWIILRQADRESLPRALEALPTLDLCHYDSDKSYHGRMWAYSRLWDALRPGGLFISDDVCDNVGFRDFAAIVHCEPMIVECNGKYVGLLHKPR